MAFSSLHNSTHFVFWNRKQSASRRKGPFRTKAFQSWETVFSRVRVRIGSLTPRKDQEGELLHLVYVLCHGPWTVLCNILPVIPCSVSPLFAVLRSYFLHDLLPWGWENNSYQGKSCWNTKLVNDRAWAIELKQDWLHTLPFQPYDSVYTGS